MFAEFLTVAAEEVALAFAAVFVIDFCSGLAHLWKSAAPAPQVEPPQTPQQPESIVNSVQCCTQPEPQSVPVVEDPWLLDVVPCTYIYCRPEAIAPTPLLLLPAKSVTQSPDLASLGAEQLRRLCAARGIRWRNAHASGRHLRKTEMITMLTA